MTVGKVGKDGMKKKGPCRNWLCLGCRYNSFGRNIHCHSCGTPSPGTGNKEVPQDWRTSGCSLSEQQVVAKQIDSLKGDVIVKEEIIASSLKNVQSKGYGQSRAHESSAAGSSIAIQESRDWGR